MGKLLAILFISYSAQSWAILSTIKPLDSFKCQDRFPHHSFCKAVEFKKWKVDERKLFEKALKSLTGSEFKMIERVLKTSRFRGIHRITYTAGWYADRDSRMTYFYRADDLATLWVDPVTGIIGVLDAFFKKINAFEKEEQFKQLKHDLVHELAHAFEITLGDLSGEDEFKQAFNWVWSRENSRYELDRNDYQEILDDFFEMVENKNPKRTWPEVTAYDRSQGEYYGLPSLYSAINPQESFAEHMANYLLNPEYKFEATREQLRYFENLFKSGSR